jgi:hypothetical protein
VEVGRVVVEGQGEREWERRDEREMGKWMGRGD